MLLLLHIAISRLLILLRMETRPMKVAVASILSGLIITLGFLWLVYLRSLEVRSYGFYGLLYASMVYGCFSYAYLHLCLMGETARRLHILYELKMRGTLSKEKLALDYGANDIIVARLNRLIRSGQLRLKGNRYQLNKTFLCAVSRLLLIWAQLIGFRSDKLSSTTTRSHVKR